MKKCPKCKRFKSFDEFNKNRAKLDGLSFECKICLSKIRKKYSRTKNGLIATIYGNQKNHSKKRKHNPPNYTLSQLRSWILLQDLFHKLYENWVKSDYKKDLVPSVDRKKDNLPYTLDNIQLMTWEENNEKGHEDIRSGKLICSIKSQKPVLQFDLQGNFIKEYVSMAQAERETNIHRGHISATCKNVYKSACGYIWKLKN